MNAGFDYNEASDMLAFSYAADILGSHATPDGVVITPPLPNKNNPLQDDGKTYPYPTPIWPEGWEPAFPTLNKNPWHASVLNPEPLKILAWLLGKKDLGLGANTVLAAYNPSKNAYVISFAGTQNLLGVLEDIAAIPFTAGPIDWTWRGIGYKSDTYYYSNPEYYPEDSGEGEPKVIMPLMHIGFRLAVEQFTINAFMEKFDLIKQLKSLGKSEIDLYVTGHSLGGAMAGVFSAWLQANEFDGLKINFKTYTFASPKIGNDSFANNYNLGATLKGMHQRVFNTLDSVPQLPFTIQLLKDLNNPAMIGALIPKPKAEEANAVELGETEGLTETVDEANADTTTEGRKNRLAWASALIKKYLPEQNKLSFSWPNLNYEHAGNPIPVLGSFPVQFQGTYYPAKFFPGLPPTDKQPLGPNEKGIALAQTWWQHWPCVYKVDLDNQFGN